MLTKTSSGEYQEEIVEVYEWDGNTAYHSSGYHVFNEYGYMLEVYQETDLVKTCPET